MSKIFKYAYQSVEEAAAGVEHLLVAGYAPADITVVTYKENKGRIESLTIADIDPVTQAHHQSIWDRTRDIFTDGDLENPLGKYNLDPSITERYNKAVKNGGFVILIEESSQSNQTDDLIYTTDADLENEDILSNVGEYSAAHADIPQSNDKKKSLTVDGIPVKKTDGTFGGEHPIDNPSMPLSPGTNQDTDARE
ncbi:Heat induced stress protein YflT [Carnobacterium iners]|uniref:Heat induced stress protein YflT n=1 Tax=Carnobacterium iners TaxID=1073423 RepID=A0A1X7N2W8_9LACT|nr:general stress protein [Carnobacterium iners]SEK96145.1 Heat induced stress protein YflT [Carnobacterium iners]SMH31151.1 Heat induced stress protein YflT [Carnobacterium iners]